MKRQSTKKEKALELKVAELTEQVARESAALAEIQDAYASTAVAGSHLADCHQRLVQEHIATLEALRLSNQAREITAQGLMIERDELANRAARLDMRIRGLGH